MRVLVTGSNGFVGSAVCRHLARSGMNVRGAVRAHRESNLPESEDASWEILAVGDINQSTEWQRALKGVDVVIHTAARVHVMHEQSSDPLAEFRSINAAGTNRLAREAARVGVQRVVYLSSIAVNGQITSPSTAFRETDVPGPQDFYGVSKFEAELALRQIASETGLEVVIVRPPLVYGPNARGNVIALLSLAYRGIPLPLRSVANARSFVAVENLCSFLNSCVTHPGAAGETFLVSDRCPLSTPELFRLLSASMGKQARLFSVSRRLLKVACRLCGLESVYRRLCESLVIDTRKAATRLGWQAPIGAEEALKQTGRWYLESKHQGLGRH